MITKRLAGERGHAVHGWLDTWHTFSFAQYHDPRHMGFRSLRVLNDDRVAPGQGFGMHGHRDMEIVTYVLDGALEHRDSLGTGSVLRPGDVQRMSAGRGVRHSEFNHSATEPLRLLQIWILPARDGDDPSYEEKRFADADKQGRLRLIVSPDGADGSLSIHQDARIFASLLAPGASVAHELAAGRHAWLQVARGGIELNGLALGEGDGAAVSEVSRLEIAGTAGAEVMLFDLA
ncbi:MAG TPA: pirin family protein [Candidatus Krumholzibacteria bacterium]|nr:pirin family protein [Candidatus Krumholzibacteria bacterium]HPD72700.1 pirin family protein [Candidatus Krumholzibacteria bacterium]HRY40368.1 pirin family protein [Candidatus Krumholzibacteria bacterium]